MSDPAKATEGAGEAIDQGVPMGDQGAGQPTPQEHSTEHSDGSLGWRKQLKQEYWDHDEAKSIESPTQLFEAYLEQKRKNGEAIPQLPENPSEEDLAAFYKKIGAPDTANDYRLPKEDDVPEGYAGKLAEFAAAAHLTQHQFEALYRSNVEARKAQLAELEKQAGQTEKAVKKQYGQDAIETGLRIAKKLGGQKLRDKLEGSLGVKADPDVMAFIAAVGQAIDEDSIELGSASGGPRDERTETGMPKLRFKGPSTR